MDEPTCDTSPHANVCGLDGSNSIDGITAAWNSGILTWDEDDVLVLHEVVT